MNMIKIALILIKELLFIKFEGIKATFHKKPPRNWESGKSGNAILIPGFLGSWYYLRKTGNFLNNLGYKIHIVTSIERNIYPISYGVNEIKKYILKHNLSKLIIVAHSKGGIISRLLLQDTEMEKRVKEVINLSVPNIGTLWGVLRIFNVHELTPWSKQIKEVNKNQNGIKKIINIYPEADPYVIPNKSLYLEGARNIQVNIVGHVNILNSPITLEKISKLLND